MKQYTLGISFSLILISSILPPASSQAVTGQPEGKEKSSCSQKNELPMAGNSHYLGLAIGTTLTDNLPTLAGITQTSIQLMDTTGKPRSSSPVVFSGLVPPVTDLEPSGLTLVGTSVYFCDRVLSRIVQVDLRTTTMTTLAGGGNTWDDGVCPAARFNRPFDISLVVGTSTPGTTHVYVADSQNNAIRVITEQAAAKPSASTLLGGPILSATAAFPTTNETGVDANTTSLPLKNPQCVVATKQNNIYVCDTGNHRILSVAKSSNRESPDAVVVAGGDIGPQLLFPRDMALVEDFGLYIVDDNGLWLLLLDMLAVSTVKLNFNVTTLNVDGEGDPSLVEGDQDDNNKEAPTTPIDAPKILSVAFADGLVYIGTDRYLLWSNISETVDSTGGDVHSQLHVQVIKPTENELWLTNITRLTIHETNVYFVRDNDHRVFKLTTTTTTTEDGDDTEMVLQYTVKVWSGKEAVGDGTEGELHSATYNNPLAIQIGPAGTFYVADSGNNFIQKGEYNTDGPYISRLCPTTTHYSNDTDGVAQKARFNVPNDITYTGKEFLVSDSLNSVIRSISPSGEVQTVSPKLPDPPVCITAVPPHYAYIATKKHLFRLNLNTRNYTQLKDVSFNLTSQGSCMAFFKKQLYVVTGNSRDVTIVTRQQQSQQDQDLGTSQDDLLQEGTKVQYYPVGQAGHRLTKITVNSFEGKSPTDYDTLAPLRKVVPQQEESNKPIIVGPHIFVSYIKPPTATSGTVENVNASQNPNLGTSHSNITLQNTTTCPQEPCEGQDNTTTSSQSTSTTKSTETSLAVTPLMSITIPLYIECVELPTIETPSLPVITPTEPKKGINLIIIIVIIVGSLFIFCVLAACAVAMAKHYCRRIKSCFPDKEEPAKAHTIREKSLRREKRAKERNAGEASL